MHRYRTSEEKIVKALIAGWFSSEVIVASSGLRNTISKKSAMVDRHFCKFFCIAGI
jgi:hypothetical protein